MRRILTTGVFDLFHNGHLNFLKKIKMSNDILTVLVHSDRFASSYKRTPIIKENDRVNILNHIDFIDNVVLFDDDYISDHLLDEYDIDCVYQAIVRDKEENKWDFFYNIPILRNKMKYVDYNADAISTTSIIENVIKNTDRDCDDRYSNDNIMCSEKLYGEGYQSPCKSDIIKEYLDKDNFQNILEIGCGTGGNVFFLGDKYPNCLIKGIDISQNMIDVCNYRKQQSGLISFECLDFNDFVTTNKYDLIICRDVFMYFSTENKAKALNKINSLLSDNGILLLIDYCSHNISDSFTTYCTSREWKLANDELYKQLFLYSNLSIDKESDISQHYVDYFETGIKSINKVVLNNLQQKLKYISLNNLKWYMYVLRKTQ